MQAPQATAPRLQMKPEELAAAKEIIVNARLHVADNQNEFLGRMSSLGRVPVSGPDLATHVDRTQKIVDEAHSQLRVKNTDRLAKAASQLASTPIFAKIDPQNLALDDTPAGRRTWFVISIYERGYLGGTNSEEARVIGKDLTEIGIVKPPENGFYELTELGQHLSRELRPQEDINRVTRTWVRTRG